MTADLRERCVRSIARGLAATGHIVCPSCPHLAVHVADSVHPDIVWCQSCGGACKPRVRP